MENVRDFWRPIINDFNPVEQVRVEDVARFFVDRNEDDPVRSLISSWKLKFQLRIGQSTPYKTLLTGHPGSGKSSELLRLGYELVDDFLWCGSMRNRLCGLKPPIISMLSWPWDWRFMPPRSGPISIQILDCLTI